MSTLQRAIEIAVSAHAGQLDKSGRPYICHPMAVMRYLEGEAAQICGVLHDVLEDTDWTLGMLRSEGFSDRIIFALECLTKRSGEDYWSYLNRAMANKTTRQVKLADLEDNLDPRRALLNNEKYVIARDLVRERLEMMK
jgi:(p)ppGpp synthase/HD superfamily hydrolase